MTDIQECKRILAENPFAVYLGIELLAVETGHVLAQIKNREKLHNIYGDVHGGALYSVADNLAGIAAASCGYYVTTVNGSIQYLKAVRGLECVRCEAKVIKAGKTISSVHVDIRDEEGNLYNTAEFTYFNLKPKKDGEDNWTSTALRK